MAKNDKISMPSGIGGIVRYFDEYKSKVQLQPGHVIALIVIIAGIIIFLNIYGNSLLGI